MYLYNSLGKKRELFKSRVSGEVKVFTCGPSIYLRPHIGNYRTFLYEDVLVRYLEYKEYRVTRSMNLTDVEDKAVSEAEKSGIDVFAQTAPSKKQFLLDLELLHAKKPILAMSSTSVNEAIFVIERLLEKGYAYNDHGNIFFNPKKDKDFGKLYGLDMSKWPKKRVQYRLDTYPGIRWNLGDFILWHKVDSESLHTKAAWDSPWGKGRPSWNVQDSAMILQTLERGVDINCGGIDNIVRHHDYNIAVMESAFDETFANYYLHGAHLFIDGKKMSKSTGNIFYPEDLKKRGFSGEEIRFFLIATKHYRKRLNFTWKEIERTSAKRKILLDQIRKMFSRVSSEKTHWAKTFHETFMASMDEDLSVRLAVEALQVLFRKASIHPSEEKDVKKVLSHIDDVLQIDWLSTVK